MLRFAPSPTGDMHIGNLRAAIFNFIIAKQKGEKFLIRIEDTDSARNIEGADKEILALLNLFGLFWDKLVYQSENFPLHRKLAQNLIEKNKAFYCYATKDFLDKKREEASTQKRAFRYNDSWAEACKSQNLNPVIRLRGIAESGIDSAKQKNSSLRDSAKQNRGNPLIEKNAESQGGLPHATSRARNDNIRDFAESISFFDAIKGECKFSANELDSFVILRENNIPTYNFACAVDDMIYDISFIIRGEDHTSNTPKQMLIHRALGYDKAIKYAHLPIILNDEGKKMSKRESESSVKWLLSQGFLPRAIVNYLLLMGNNPPCEIFTLEEAISWFDLSQLSKSPVRFDINQLRHINREHLKRLGADEMGLLLVESNEKLKKVVGNSSLGLHSADFANLGRFADLYPVSHPKFAKNHESQTENPSVVDSADSQNLIKNNLARSANLETRPLRGAKNRIQGRSSASADFLLEAEKRGSPPKSEKRQLLARRGSGEGGAALLREKTSEFVGKGGAESTLDSANRAKIAESTLTNSLGALGLIFLEEASTLNELNDKLNHIFAPKDLENFEFGENARILRNEILRLAESNAESNAQSSALNDFESLKSALSSKVDFKGKAFFMPLRFLLTGAQKGPHLDALYPHLRAFLSQILQILKDE